jgi:hypothetical protein
VTWQHTAFAIASVFAAMGLGVSILAYRITELRLRLEQARNEHADWKALKARVERAETSVRLYEKRLTDAENKVNDAATTVALGRRAKR